MEAHHKGQRKTPMNKKAGGRPKRPATSLAKDAISYPEDLQGLIAFHGHLCPGLLIGYRATQLGLRRLKVKAAQDEELIAIVENKSCSVDAVQFLSSCTFGKGNLFYHPYGKQVFIFARRPSGEAIRISLRKEAEEGLPERRPARRRQFTSRLFTAPDKDLFKARRITVAIPPPAQIYSSLPCQACGELVMEIAGRMAHGKFLCQSCLEAEITES